MTLSIERNGSRIELYNSTSITQNKFSFGNYDNITYDPKIGFTIYRYFTNEINQLFVCEAQGFEQKIIFKGVMYNLIICII